MDDPKLLERMRADWNERANEDAYYYVAFARREQDDEEFFATAADVVRGLDRELKRCSSRESALEIGCGPGRLMRPMAGRFAEVHGIDVSDEMIRLARERLDGVPNAHLHHNSGSDLALFPGEKFDFVYSYAVFQHIPSREVVLNYLLEARRVLKTGGVLRFQVNGLPERAKRYDTWSGVRIAPEEIAAFARDRDFQLLALDGVWTQYMWVTCRKRPKGWTESLADRPVESAARIWGIINALSGEAVAPAAGPMASISVWMGGLPEECDLNHMTVSADGRRCRMTYIGHPGSDGILQVDARLPDGLRSGIVPVELAWLGQPVCRPGWVRVMPARPSVPRIASITDGVNLVSGSRVVSGSVKVAMVDVAQPSEFHAMVDGVDVGEADSFCVDPVMERYEFNFRLPEGIAHGPHEVRVALGRRRFAPVAIEVA